MKELTIRICTAEDVNLLAILNKELIEDENHDNPMNLDQLKDRMYAFISSDYKAYLFVVNEDTVGYALVKHSNQPLYLRQFYICRNFRRMGYGKLAFYQLLELLNTKHIDIEVMFWNHAGYSFWKSLGFKERSIYMRLEG